MRISPEEYDPQCNSRNAGCKKNLQLETPEEHCPDDSSFSPPNMFGNVLGRYPGNSQRPETGGHRSQPRYIVEVAQFLRTEYPGKRNRGGEQEYEPDQSFRSVPERVACNCLRFVGFGVRFQLGREFLILTSGSGLNIRVRAFRAC